MEAILALIFRASPKAPAFSVPRQIDGRQIYRNGKVLLEFKKVDIGQPPRNTNIKYSPTTELGQEIGARQRGYTSFWGDIKVSVILTGKAEQKTLLHEKVHQFLTPKFYFLRNVRVQLRANSYFNSQLLRYIEEALAEGFSQLMVYGVRESLSAISFPVKGGYVTIAGLKAEARGILLGPVVVSGLTYNVLYSPSNNE